MITRQTITRPFVVLGLVATLSLPGLVALARGESSPEESQIPTEFTNLQLLPADIAQSDLIGIMRNFAGGLGVRCNHCHVGENPDTLQGFDFASDEKETKLVARAMLKMVREINNTLLPATGREELLRVRCVTCHHGNTRPETLEQVLARAIREGGIEAGVTKYRELREQYYGRAVYDFGPGTLFGVAEDLARREDDPEGAETMLRLNLEFHPETAFVHYALGEVLLMTGDDDGALEHFEMALELEPDNQFYKRRVDRLKQQES